MRAKQGESLPDGSGEYELRCLSPQDLYTLGHALEAVYAETDAAGELRWPGRDSRPEELWFLIAMVYGHEGGQRMRPRAAFPSSDCHQAVAPKPSPGSRTSARPHSPMGAGERSEGSIA